MDFVVNVLQVLPSIASKSGGPVRSTLAACQAIRSVEPEICFTLATTDNGLESAGWREAYKREMPAGMELEVFPSVGRHTFMISPHLAAWLWRHTIDFELVVVRALFHPVSSSTAWIARRRSVPYLVVPHGTLSRYTFGHRRTLMKRVYFRLVERHTLAGAAGVRFTSEAEASEAPQWAADTPSRAIPHPYEPRFVQDEDSKRKPEQILFLSRLHPVKGIDTLLEALRLILGEIPGVRLILAGSGTPRFERHVWSEIRRLGLEGSVELPGFVENQEKARLLTESSVFVLPSHHENFGIAAVEAMDAGLPVVISREVDIWPHVENAGAGIVLPERTPGALADALARLLAADSLREHMARNGQKLVRTAFDPKTVGRELLEVYRAAAGGRSRSTKSVT